MTPPQDEKPGTIERFLEAVWRRNRFGRVRAVEPNGPRQIRRTMERSLGRRLSGRQWKRWAKQQRRAERRWDQG